MVISILHGWQYLRAGAAGQYPTHKKTHLSQRLGWVDD
jgi:hypothetical protein